MVYVAATMALSYLAASGRWPPDVPWGTPSPDLRYKTLKSFLSLKIHAFLVTVLTM